MGKLEKQSYAARKCDKVMTRLMEYLIWICLATFAGAFFCGFLLFVSGIWLEFLGMPQNTWKWILFAALLGVPCFAFCLFPYRNVVEVEKAKKMAGQLHNYSLKIFLVGLAFSLIFGVALDILSGHSFPWWGTPWGKPWRVVFLFTFAVGLVGLYMFAAGGLMMDRIQSFWNWWRVKKPNRFQDLLALLQKKWREALPGWLGMIFVVWILVGFLMLFGSLRTFFKNWLIAGLLWGLAIFILSQRMKKWKK